MKPYAVAYQQAFHSGVLADRKNIAYEHLRTCTLCPRQCKVDRLAGETGFCKTGEMARIASFCPHFGEEAPLVGANGSGTIFFTHCNLRCIFCQNFDISHEGAGQSVTPAQLAATMLHLQQTGCHNINLVTPSHVVPQILAALEIAAADGLHVPLVYNSSGYDFVTTLKLLDGIVDIYMPDFKFWDSEVARKACEAPDYPEIARLALLEMHRQVGNLECDADGIATRGLLIRHLVMPQGLAGTERIMKFIADQISVDSYVNIMSQYRPCGRAEEYAELAEYPDRADFNEAHKAARKAGLHRLDRPRHYFVRR